MLEQVVLNGNAKNTLHIIVVFGRSRCPLYTCMSDEKGEKTSLRNNAIRPETSCVCASVYFSLGFQ